MNVEKLAQVLHSLTDGLDGEGTAAWPDPAHREVYALAVEEVTQAILADPGPLLLEGLAEAGLLERHISSRPGCRDCSMYREGHTHRRYVTEWEVI